MRSGLSESSQSDVATRNLWSVNVNDGGDLELFSASLVTNFIPHRRAVYKSEVQISVDSSVNRSWA